MTITDVAGDPVCGAHEAQVAADPASTRITTALAHAGSSVHNRYNWRFDNNFMGGQAGPVAAVCFDVIEHADGHWHLRDGGHDRIEAALRSAAEGPTRRDTVQELMRIAFFLTERGADRVADMLLEIGARVFPASLHRALHFEGGAALLREYRRRATIGDVRGSNVPPAVASTGTPRLWQLRGDNGDD